MFESGLVVVGVEVGAPDPPVVFRVDDRLRLGRACSGGPGSGLLCHVRSSDALPGMCLVVEAAESEVPVSLNFPPAG